MAKTDSAGEIGIWAANGWFSELIGNRPKVSAVAIVVTRDLCNRTLRMPCRQASDMMAHRC